MSATGRGAERVAHDHYPTPVWPTHRLLEAEALPREKNGRAARWIEPCSGEGAIVRSVTAFDGAVLPAWTTVDIRDETRFEVPDYTTHHIGDYRELAEGLGRFDVALTNPPFNLALEMLLVLREFCDVVAFLLRLNWLEGPRAKYLRASGNMPDVYVLPQRPGFVDEVLDKKTGKWRRAGTDATAYSWMLWGGPLGGGQIRMLRDTPRAIRSPRRETKAARRAHALKWLVHDGAEEER